MERKITAVISHLDPLGIFFQHSNKHLSKWVALHLFLLASDYLSPTLDGLRKAAVQFALNPENWPSC